MSPSMPLVAALSDYIAAHMSTMSPYAWEIRESAWKSLHTGFDYRKFAGNLPRQNIELKRHLSEHWAVSSLDEKIRVATWIVKDWGGINRNSEMTILSYVNQADAERPATPFFGIASYSKILSIKDPEGYAVFDARVAASLNAIQLLLDRDKRLVPPHLLVFFAPVGQNETINRFNSAAFPVALKRLGFSAVERNAIYGTYMASVHAISGIIHKSVLEIEMFLFAQAVQLSEEALPLARAIPPT